MTRIFMLLAVLFSTLPAHAGVMTFTQGSFEGTSLRDEYPQQGDRYQSAVSAIGVNASFSAAANANYGVLKAVVSGAASTPQLDAYSGGPYPPIQYAAATATATFNDSFTLVNEALTGTKGLLTVSFYSASNLEANAYTPYSYDAATARYMLDVSMGTSYAGVKNSRLIINQALTDNMSSGHTLSSSLFVDDATGQAYAMPAGNYYTLTQEFVWGTSLYLQMSMFVDGVAPRYTYPYFSDSYGSFLADASHSAYWAGVTSVSSGGIKVTDYALVSASKTDYAHSFVPTENDVPEPGSIALFMIASTGLLAAARRNKRK